MGGDIEAIQSIGGAQIFRVVRYIVRGCIMPCITRQSFDFRWLYSPGKNIYVANGTVKTTGGYFSDKSVPLGKKRL